MAFKDTEVPSIAEFPQLKDWILLGVIVPAVCCIALNLMECFNIFMPNL